jgi:hypothetical protein
LLFLSVDIPKAEIVVIDGGGGHFKRVPSTAGGEAAFLTAGTSPRSSRDRYNFQEPLK